ncbi:MAG: L,D-transpeptidase [Rhizobiaceae bacterium]|nr:L,D-transpeptidase [Rhizobiaceae bacterium]
MVFLPTKDDRPLPSLTFRPSRPRAARLFVACLALAAAAFAAPSADARDRHSAVKVSPDLAAEWLLQLSPGSGVVPGYQRPHLSDARRNYEGVTSQGQAPTAIGRRTGFGRAPRTDNRRPLVDPGYTGSVTRQASVARPRQMKRVDSIDPKYLPQTVSYKGSHRPGTVVIDTDTKFLYLVEPGGTARRYGVGVGKPGFEWAGTHKVTQKREWPTWTPPAQMRAREKKKGRILPVRMEGGPENPLGARAMYLGSTLYRIHGTNQPWTIGQAVSSGCIRMRNEDVSDLYERVPVGTRVIVL